MKARRISWVCWGRVCRERKDARGSERRIRKVGGGGKKSCIAVSGVECCSGMGWRGGKAQVRRD